jgi:tetratricopeptide (TPR) repeat protein
LKKNIIRYFFLLSLIIITTIAAAFSQNADAQLAFKYYQNQEYDKAAVLYEKLYRETGYKNNRDYYLRCLSEMKDFDTSEKFLKKELKKNKFDFYLVIDLGMVYQQSNRFSEANSEFENAINIVKTNQNNVIGAAAVFMGYRLYDWAEKAYLAGAKHTNYDFSMDLGNLYYVQRDYQRMMFQYLNYLEKNPQTINTIQSRLQYVMANDIDESVDPIIEAAILERIQEKPQIAVYNQLLIWQYTQSGRFKLALTQLIAVDKRTKNGENDIINFGLLLYDNLEYDLALEAFGYIIAKGRDNPYYIVAYIENLNIIYTTTTSNLNPSREELIMLEQKLAESLQIIPRKESYKIIYALVNIKAYYLNKFDEAIALIDESITEKRFKPDQELVVKLLLGDIYFLNSNPWDAILTYAQVEKAAIESPIGHEARFKKARLAYYTGQFKWAQAQLDVLKSSTSKLIANDAMELSMFISDNYNLDTTETTMKIFARADFYIFSRQYDKAFTTLDSITVLYPSHGLIDDVLYRKAEIYEAGGDFATAASFYNQVATTYFYDILADNALFRYALCEEKLNNRQSAMDAYLKLITDFPGSIFAVEARKNLRNLSNLK